jgi:hypothetical protein
MSFSLHNERATAMGGTGTSPIAGLVRSWAGLRGEGSVRGFGSCLVGGYVGTQDLATSHRSEERPLLRGSNPVSLPLFVCIPGSDPKADHP